MDRLASWNYLTLGDNSYWGGEGGFMSAHAYHLSFIMVCARAAPKEGVFLALSCQALARLLLADLVLVLWSRRVVAL